MAGERNILHKHIYKNKEEQKIRERFRNYFVGFVFEQHSYFPVPHCVIMH